MALSLTSELGPQEVYTEESLWCNAAHVAGYYPPLLPHGQYGDNLASSSPGSSPPGSSPGFFHPLKSLGRPLLNSTTLPHFGFNGMPTFLNNGPALPREPFYNLPPGSLPFFGNVSPEDNRPFPKEGLLPVDSSIVGSGSGCGSGSNGNSNKDCSDSGHGLSLILPLAETSVPWPTKLLSPKISPQWFSGPAPSRFFSYSPRKKRYIDSGPSSQRTELENPRQYDFTEDDLRLVLYGAIRSQQLPARLHCAISGLRVPPDSSGAESVIQSLDKDSLKLPEGLCILKTMCGDIPQFGVFCSSLVPKGIRFGPFLGKVVNASEIKTYGDNSLMWEIFEDGHLSHFIDGKGASGNWMSLVNCARFPEEQNLSAVQCQGQIFYESCKEILPNQELLVWYGDCYQQFLGIPVSLKVLDKGKQPLEPPEESGESHKCERCGKVFAYKYYRDKHLKYTRCVDQGDRKFPCNLCSRSFEKRDRLRIHILHVHEKHRPHKCSMCGKSFSQSSSLNKHMRVHSGERPYKCVYCNKAFTASSILRTHIRQHSGEKPFKCKYCGKAFASHAAHDSHVRRSHNKEGGGCSCGICGKIFSEQEKFRCHMKFHGVL
ncbi:PR domain zinc finger protein 14 [Monodelphis domestica]|uniref:PR domain zinc finger protein 14 n=1 Tax=Monodelphis domestica TaxID=13616 RepID=UPI00020F6551|nr:PR domain zinc finger protein 14 [Monodelphis domestica]